MKSSILYIIFAILLYIGIASSCNRTTPQSDQIHAGYPPLFTDSLQSQVKAIGQVNKINQDSINITKPLIMQGWFYLEDISSKSHTVFGAKNLFLLNTTSNGGLHFNQPEIADTYIDSLSISPFEWNHYAIKINRPYVEVYLNGKKVGNTEWVKDYKAIQPIQPVIIGWQNWNDTSNGYTYGFEAKNKSAHSLDSIDFSIEHLKITNQLPLITNLIFFHTFDNKNSYWHINHKEIHYKGEPQFYIDNNKISYAHFDSICSFNIATEEIHRSLTIACKIKQEAFYRDYGALITIGEYIALRTSNNKMYATIPQVRDFYSQYTKFPKNEWVHLAMTYVEKKGVTYYINGKKCDFLEEKRTLQAFKDILIGRNRWNNKLIADIDNIFVWSRALNENDILQIATINEKDLSNQVLSNQPKQYSTIAISIIGILLLIITYVIIIDKKKKSQDQDNSLDHLCNDNSSYSSDTFINSDSTGSHREDVAEKFKEKLDQIITENLSSSEFQIKELAAEMGLSRTVLYNQCSEYLSESPKQYIRNIRLDHAKKLLTETDKPIIQIMDETGFESRAYFAKCIKERFGVTPASLRQIP